MPHVGLAEGETALPPPGDIQIFKCDLNTIYFRTDGQFFHRIDHAAVDALLERDDDITSGEHYRAGYRDGYIDGFIDGVCDDDRFGYHHTDDGGDGYNAGFSDGYRDGYTCGADDAHSDYGGDFVDGSSGEDGDVDDDGDDDGGGGDRMVVDPPRGPDDADGGGDDSEGGGGGGDGDGDSDGDVREYNRGYRIGYRVGFIHASDHFAVYNDPFPGHGGTGFEAGYSAGHRNGYRYGTLDTSTDDGDGNDDGDGGGGDGGGDDSNNGGGGDDGGGGGGGGGGDRMEVDPPEGVDETGHADSGTHLHQTHLDINEDGNGGDPGLEPWSSVRQLRQRYLDSHADNGNDGDLGLEPWSPAPATCQPRFDANVDQDAVRLQNIQFLRRHRNHVAFRQRLRNAFNNHSPIRHNRSLQVLGDADGEPERSSTRITNQPPPQFCPDVATVQQSSPAANDEANENDPFV